MGGGGRGSGQPPAGAPLVAATRGASTLSRRARRCRSRRATSATAATASARRWRGASLASATPPSADARRQRGGRKKQRTTRTCRRGCRARTSEEGGRRGGRRRPAIRKPDCAPKDPAAAAAADAALRRADALWAGRECLVLLTVDGTAAGVLLLDDSLKPEAAATVAGLKEPASAILTGDRRLPLCASRRPSASPTPTRRRPPPEEKQRHILAHTWPPGWRPRAPGLGDGGVVAADAGIGRARGGMPPKPSRGPLAVGFVGDGLNDCPACLAHVGIVLQEAGSQATVDAASAVPRSRSTSCPPRSRAARAARVDQPLPRPRHQRRRHRARRHRRPPALPRSSPGFGRPARRPRHLLAVAADLARRRARAARPRGGH